MAAKDKKYLPVLSVMKRTPATRHMRHPNEAGNPENGLIFHLNGKKPRFGVIRIAKTRWVWTLAKICRMEKIMRPYLEMEAVA